MQARHAGEEHEFGHSTQQPGTGKQDPQEQKVLFLSNQVCYRLSSGVRKIRKVKWRIPLLCESTSKGIVFSALPPLAGNLSHHLFDSSFPFPICFE